MQRFIDQSYRITIKVIIVVSVCNDTSSGARRPTAAERYGCNSSSRASIIVFYSFAASLPARFLRRVDADPAEVGAGSSIHGWIARKAVARAARDHERRDAGNDETTAERAAQRTAAVALQTIKRKNTRSTDRFVLFNGERMHSVSSEFKISFRLSQRSHHPLSIKENKSIPRFQIFDHLNFDSSIREST